MIRRLGRAISDNLASILLATLLAAFIWANAVRQDNPSVTDQFILTVQTYASPEIIYDTQETSVQVEIEAPKSILDRIPSEPGRTFQAVVDLTSVGFGDQVVPIEIQFTDEAIAEFDQDELEQIIISSRFPSESNVNLDQEITRDIPVRVVTNGSVAPTHRSGEPLADPEVITVTGPNSTVELIDEIKVSVFLDNSRESISVSRTPLFYNSADEIINVGRLSTSSESVNVTVEVEERANTGDIAISVDWTGDPADDHRLLGFETNPLNILVTGPPATIDTLRRNLIKTEQINITGLTEPRIFEVRLNLPDGVSRVDGETPIVVTALIEPITTLDVVVVKPQVIGLADDFTATLLTDAVEVNVFGPLTALRSLDADEVRVEVDLFEIIEAGEYEIQPQVNVPQQRGIEFRGIDPSEVTVLVEEVLIEPTPTLTNTSTITDTQPVSGTESLTGEEEGWTVPHVPNQWFMSNPPTFFTWLRRLLWQTL